MKARTLEELKKARKVLIAALISVLISWLICENQPICGVELTFCTVQQVAVQEFSRVLALDYQEMAGGRKSEQLVEVTKAEVDVVRPTKVLVLTSEW
eukprot:3933418-Rhodomonas_salina.2